MHTPLLAGECSDPCKLRLTACMHPRQSHTAALIAAADAGAAAAAAATAASTSAAAALGASGPVWLGPYALTGAAGDAAVAFARGARAARRRRKVDPKSYLLDPEPWDMRSQHKKASRQQRLCMLLPHAQSINALRVFECHKAVLCKKPAPLLAV